MERAWHDWGMSASAKTVGEYMTSCPYTIGDEQPIAAAAHKMRELQVRHLPVLSGGVLVGVLSDRDIALVESLAGVDPQTLAVSEAMTQDPTTVQVDAPLAEVAALMASKKFGSVLVLEGERLRGLFTTTDALNALAELLAG